MKIGNENTFLITGGAGFIGSNLTKKILDFGSKVIIIDNLKLNGLGNLPEDKNLTFYNDSIQNFDLSLLPNLSCVFHLAAQANVPISINNFYQSSSNNNVSSLKIVDFCCERKIPLIFASSSAVYGGLEKGHEDGEIDLIHPYSVDKYIIELYLSMAHKLYGLKSCGLRFFNVYGPYQDGSNPYSGVISIFINRLLKKESIDLYGGKQTRDFIYVEDVVDSLLLAYEFLLNNHVAEVFNVLSGKSITIDSLAIIIGEIIGVKPLINYLSSRKGDPQVSVGNSKHIKKINFKPKINIRKGLELTINWIRSEIEKNKL